MICGKRSCVLVFHQLLHSTEKKAYEAIQQIKGYMINSGLIYGFLTTWRRWSFLRTNGSTLSVSHEFPQNPTIFQLFGRFLLATRDNFKLQIPTDTEIKDK
jgi:hypothetical protein